MATTYDKASLVMIPSGYKDDKLYSVKPTDGSGDFTFSRDGSGASPATRVNASGLIEKGRENILLQSNTFSNASWIKASGTTITGGQSGYDGSSDAWLLSKSASFARIEQVINFSGVVAFSVYAKAGTHNFLYLRLDDSGSKEAYFNLSTGAVATNNVITTKVDSIVGGWYRCTIVWNASAGTYARIYPSDVDNGVGNTGAGNIYIQDAQLEQGLVATDYIETTTAPVSAGLLGDMPRLDYSGGATCPSLLLEPSRVNIVTQSEYLNGITSAGGTITDNATTSPEGVVNAGLYTENTSTTYHRFNTGTQTYTQNQAYSFSVFAKADSGSRYVIVNCNSAFNARAYFDIDNGTYTTNAGTADIQDYGNGWYRCIVTGTRTAADGADSIYFGLNTTQADSAYTGDGTSGAYFWGAQLESGSYPTSYIPTYGSASTRGADSCSKTSATALIGQTEGTILCEINTSTKTLSSSWAFSVNDGTTSNYIGLRRSGGNEFFAHINVAGSTTALIGTGITSGVHKIAIAYANNDIQVYVDGASVGTDTSSAIPATSVIELGDLISNRYLDDSIKQFVTFPTRLTNAELAALTA